MTQEELENLGRTLSLKEIKFIDKNHPTKKTSSSNGFTGKCYQIFLEEIISNLYKFFQKTENEGTLPKSFIRLAIHYYKGQTKTLQENYR